MYNDGPSPLQMIGCLIAGVLGLVGVFALAWVLFLGSIFGPANVSAQWQFAYDYNATLKAIALNVCSFDKLAAEATDPNIKEARIEQAQAYVTLYHTRESEYNSRLQNNFQAGLVKPPDVPKVAPTLEEEEAAVCV